MTADVPGIDGTDRPAPPRSRPALTRLAVRLFHGRRPPMLPPAPPAVPGPPSTGNGTDPVPVDVLTDAWFDDLLRHLDAAATTLRADCGSTRRPTE